MTTYIAILRGINVSGQRPVQMEALRKMCMALGMEDVETYIQSGNIIFRSNEEHTSTLNERISKAILDTFGHYVPVFTLSADELLQTINANPFAQVEDVDITKLHVTVLSDIPDPKALSALLSGNYGEDSLAAMNRAIYVQCPNGYGRTKLNNNFLEKRLNVSATTRNWKTTLKLAEMVYAMNER